MSYVAFLFILSIYNIFIIQLSRNFIMHEWNLKPLLLIHWTTWSQASFLFAPTTHGPEPIWSIISFKPASQWIRVTTPPITGNFNPFVSVILVLIHDWKRKEKEKFCGWNSTKCKNGRDVSESVYRGNVRNKNSRGVKRIYDPRLTSACRASRQCPPVAVKDTAAHFSASINYKLTAYLVRENSVFFYY